MTQSNTENMNADVSFDGISVADARGILELRGAAFQQAISRATKLREHNSGDSFNLCWIVNAKSGNCSQDCAFCAQSSRSSANSPSYPMLDVDEIVRAAVDAKQGGAVRFSLVTSGRSLKPGRELDAVCEANRGICETGLKVCGSFGCVDRDVLETLRDSGLVRYHHNLETAESLWPSICSTRPYEDSRRVVRDAIDVGLGVCTGGIFGLGESLEQRIELLDEVRRLNVDSVAINFFVPIPGTPLGNVDELTPLDGLRIIVAARLMMPQKEIRVCGGREKNIRDLQGLIPLAGASGMMIGGYLTTPGREPEVDLQMLRDLGLKPDVVSFSKGH